MAKCVILFRNTLNDRVGFVGDDDQIAVFGSRDEAIEATDRVPVCRAYPWKIVEIDDL